MNLKYQSCFIALLLLLSGCKSKLIFELATYDYDKRGNDQKAQEVYNSIHPPYPTVLEQKTNLEAQRSAIEEYKAYLITYNMLVQGLFFPENADSKTEIIKNLFKPVEMALADEKKQLDTLEQQHGPQVPAFQNAAIPILWYNMQEKFKDEKIETDPEGLAKVIDQLESQTNAALIATNLETIKTKLGELPEENRLGETAPLMQLLHNKEPSKEDKTKAVDTYKDQKHKTVEKVTQTQSIGGDSIVRVHYPFQDMSDPFWKYIANHPKNWVTLDNKASVAGFGDTEYILVVENNLDGRFKSITADPTAVIQARLKISRAALQAVTAVGGIITQAYGVPLPSSLEKDGKSELDFSTMTGEQNWLAVQNEQRKQSISDLRNFAINELDNINTNNAALLLQQLNRKSAWVSNYKNEQEK